MRNRPLTVFPVTRLPSPLLSLTELRLPPPPLLSFFHSAPSSASSSLKSLVLELEVNSACSWREQRFIPPSEQEKRTHGLAGIGGSCVRLSVLFFFVSEGWGRNRINAIRDSGLVGEVGSVRFGSVVVLWRLWLQWRVWGDVNKERCVNCWWWPCCHSFMEIVM